MTDSVVVRQKLTQHRKEIFLQLKNKFKKIFKKSCGNIYSGILLSHKKEGNRAICSNRDGPRDNHGRTLTSYMTIGKTIALTIWTFVGKVMSQLFNTLSRFVINFLPRSKHLLISWPQSSSAVILEPPQIKSVTVSTVSPSICMK